MDTAKAIIDHLHQLADPKKARIFSRFFKTGPGQYGEGDQFFGIMTGPLDKLVKEHWSKLSFVDIEQLLSDVHHESRSVAVSVLKVQFQKTKDPQFRKQIYEFYLSHTSRINNWDLVDISTPHIVGAYLLDESRQILYKLAQSPILWERRMSIMATFAFIRQNDFVDTIKISQLLLNDEHDLIHKAVGWMLREVGKRDIKTLTNFLDQLTPSMPRTMLRYAIEKLPDDTRQHYLQIPRKIY